MHKNILSGFSFLRKNILMSIGVFAMLVPGVSLAQQAEAVPDLPAPIKTLVEQGTQVRFLGREHGLEGWVAIRNGQEQYFYVVQGGKAFVSGVLFDETGKMITIDQVNRLRQSPEGAMLDVLASDSASDRAQAENKSRYEFMTPSEQLFWDVENSNWIPIGKAGTPVFYSFIDPLCPHCHEMMVALKPYIDAGDVQVRMIPVGNSEQSKAQAAFLMAVPNPEGTWWRHMDGDRDALPAKQGINMQGVERNMLVMQTWKLNATPILVYRGKDNSVKIITGKPKDIDALIKDLGSRV